MAKWVIFDIFGGLARGRLYPW